MQIVDREEFLQYLEMLEPGLANKALAEQTNCYLFLDKKIVTYNTEISCSLKNKFGISGAIRADSLLKILRKLTDTSLEVDQTEKQLILKGKRKKTKITMQNKITLDLSTVDKPGEWKKLNEDFGEAIGIVQSCAGKDESMEILTCVHITSDYVETSDNLQFARYNIKTNIDKNALVRRDAIKHITELGMEEFSETKNWIHFKNSSGLVYSCRRIDVKKFPDSTRIMKLSGEKTVFPKSIGESIGAADVFSSEMEENNLIVTLSHNKMKLKGIGITGEHTEWKKAVYKGPDITFTLPSQLLAEITKKQGDTSIEMCVSENIIKIDGKKWKYVTTLGITNEEDD